MSTSPAFSSRNPLSHSGASVVSRAARIVANATPSNRGYRFTRQDWHDLILVAQNPDQPHFLLFERSPQATANRLVAYREALLRVVLQSAGFDTLERNAARSFLALTARSRAQRRALLTLNP